MQRNRQKIIGRPKRTLETDEDIVEVFDGDDPTQDIQSLKKGAVHMQDGSETSLTHFSDLLDNPNEPDEEINNYDAENDPNEERREILKAVTEVLVPQTDFIFKRFNLLEIKFEVDHRVPLFVNKANKSSGKNINLAEFPDDLAVDSIHEKSKGVAKKQTWKDFKLKVLRFCFPRIKKNQDLLLDIIVEMVIIPIFESKSNSTFDILNDKHIKKLEKQVNDRYYNRPVKATKKRKSRKKKTSKKKGGPKQV